LINIGVWDYGSKEEFNEWATLVGDDSWHLEHTLTRFKQVSLHKYDDLSASNHGHPDEVYRWKIITMKRQQNMKITSSLAQVLTAIMGKSDGNDSTIDVNSPSRIDVSLPKIWPPGLKEAFDAWSEYGVW
jgi:hypothetical protein